MAGRIDAPDELALAQSVPLMIVVSDVVRRKYVFINRRALRWYGYDPDANCEALPFLARIHPEDMARVGPLFTRALQMDDGDVLDLEYRALHEDGTWRHVLSQVSVFKRDANGSVLQLIGAAHDITQRVELEAQLRHAQKMEAVGQLAGGVAHDFNNLLTVILGYAETMTSRLPIDDPARDDAQQIVRAGRRAATLTQQLLASARRQVSHPVPLDLNVAFGGIENMLRRLIRADIEIRFWAGRELHWVLADPVQIEQILMNLAVNARDAMPDGGVITLSTSNVDVRANSAWHARGASPGEHVRLRVEDSGTGMAASVRSRIFEPFFTTKPADRGTGLGLSVVYGIVQQAGGSIHVRSAPGRGTRFDLLFPAVPSGAEQQNDPLDAMVSAHGLETVLLVEDDQDVRRLEREGLEHHGYHVLEAAGGEEALEVVRAFDRTIHVAVTDLVMPGMGGGAFARHLADLRPETRVLFVSGYADDTPFEQGGLDRGWDYLQKPFTPAALARALRRTLASSPESACGPCRP